MLGKGGEARAEDGTGHFSELASLAVFSTEKALLGPEGVTWFSHAAGCGSDVFKLWQQPSSPQDREEGKVELL